MPLEDVVQQLPIFWIISSSTFDLLGRDQLGPAVALDAAAVINGHFLGEKFFYYQAAECSCRARTKMGGPPCSTALHHYELMRQGSMFACEGCVTPLDLSKRSLICLNQRQRCFKFIPKTLDPAQADLT